MFVMLLGGRHSHWSRTFWRGSSLGVTYAPANNNHIHVPVNKPNRTMVQQAGFGSYCWFDRSSVACLR